jgi:hypothetical protein
MSEPAGSFFCLTLDTGVVTVTARRNAMLRRHWKPLLCLFFGAAFGGAAVRLRTNDPPPQPKAAQSVRPLDADVQANVAIHEAGHAVVAAFLLGPKLVKSISVQSARADGSYGVTSIDYRDQLDTEVDILRDATVDLGGKAAESLLLGASTNGISSDLQNANNVIRARYIFYGMEDTLLVRSADEMPPQMWAAIDDDLHAASSCAEAIVMSNADLVREVAAAVTQQEVEGNARELSDVEFRAVLEAHPVQPIYPALRRGLPYYCTLHTN